MPSPDIDPDDADDATPFPLTVRVAGIVWVVFGVGGMLTGAVTAVATPFLVPILGAVLLGLVFISIACEGVRVLCGKVPDVLDDAVRSLIGAFALFGLSTLIVMQPLPPDEIPAAIGIATAGLALLVASVLALVGRMAYLRWRTENGHPEP